MLFVISLMFLTKLVDASNRVRPVLWFD